MMVLTTVNVGDVIVGNRAGNRVSECQGDGVGILLCPPIHTQALAM